MARLTVEQKLVASLTLDFSRLGKEGLVQRQKRFKLLVDHFGALRIDRVSTAPKKLENVLQRMHVVTCFTSATA